MSTDSVSTVSPSQPGTTSAYSGTKTVEQTKEEFLQLIIAQMKNQDPFSPADATQFTQQMMMMGQLEQLMNLNTSMSSMAASQQGSMIAQYSDIVGHNVKAYGNQFQITDAAKGDIQFYLPANPASVEINVFDSYGNLVRDFDAGIKLGGEQKIVFDGKNFQGQEMAPGYYTYTVDALDYNSDPMQATMYATGEVSSIRLENGQPIFQMGTEDLVIQDIKQIF